MKKKSTVFLVVYACEPNQGGEHEVGWKIANELHDKCNVVVITRTSNKQLIENFNEKNIDFRYIENNIFLRFKPKGKFSYVYYLFWQVSAFFYLKNLVTKHDIIHYLTFGNLHLPHLLFLLKGKLLLGPMGGGSIIDTSLMRTYSFKTKVKSIIYHLINLTVKINPIYYVLFNKSSKIVLRTEETLKIIPARFHKKCSIFLETGVDTSKINRVVKERKLNTIITTARIIESKNIDQVIEVFLELLKITNEPLELLIVGDGPLKSKLEFEYSHIENIHFLGKVPHHKVENLLQKADLFLFCSLKEGGSHSLFEAAMNNCPITCYNISGMKEFPRLESSIKIDPLSAQIEDNIKNLAKKIVMTFDKEGKVDEICNNAINDLKNNYDWNALGEKYIGIYKEIET